MTIRGRPKKELPKIVKNTHNKALSEMPSSGIKVDRFKHLRWFVYKPAKQLILGDAGCLYEMDGKKRFGVIYEEAKQIKNIFLLNWKKLDYRKSYVIIFHHEEIEVIYLILIHNKLILCRLLSFFFFPY